MQVSATRTTTGQRHVNALAFGLYRFVNVIFKAA